MKNTFILLIASLSFLISAAQDTYHTNLQTSLQNDYQLPVGSWMFFDNESDILNGATNFGNTATIQAATGQDFSSKSRIVVSQAGSTPFSSQWLIQNKIPIQTGDVVLAVFYLKSDGGNGKLNFFIENATTYAKEVFLTMPIDTQWRKYMIPFEATGNFANNSLSFGLHLGFRVQTIEVGGFTAINYGSSAQLGDLPEIINNEFYEGYESNAPWRAEAATRIDEFRKVDISFQTNDTNGNPLENVKVNLKMVQHDYPFGTAVTADRIAGNNNQNIIYENKLLDLDGEGHGFNWVVFENDLKWPAWESEWFVNKTELANAISWLRNNDMQIRGHTLLWPGIENMPADIGANINDQTYIKTRINDHIEDILTRPGFQGQIAEWDVLNEIMTNQDIENSFKGTPGYLTGREYFIEVFQKARATDPNIGLWINDYITLSLQQEAGSDQYEKLRANIVELINAQVDIEGVGFQGHLGGFPNGIPSVIFTFDDFYGTLGLKTKVTEFDLPSIINEDLAANYLRDFMTATFSSQSSTGFFFWSFWDGATYMNEGSNLFRSDWSMTPAGSTFVDLLFDEWWTEEIASSDALGMSTVRGFKGKYEVSYTCDGVIVRDTVSFTTDATYTIGCDNITTSLHDLQELKIQVFPNPTTGQIQIKRETATAATIRINDIRGQLLMQQQTSLERLVLDLGYLPAGAYFIQIKTDIGIFRDKLILN